jgi:hypothetical protein
MVCVFEITSIENPEFKRLIQIGSESTFEDLHLITQDTSNFDQTQLASFFLTDDNWGKQIEISLLDADKSNKRVISMRKTKLDEYISEIGQKLVYVFDFFNERYFYVELKEKLMKTDLKEPFVAYEKGNAPSQFLISDLESPEVETIDRDESYKSFGDLEDYYEIFGEMDA